MKSSETKPAKANPSPVKFERYGLPTAVLDVVETAAYFGITRDQVYKMVKTGELVHVRVGKSIRFRLEDLDAYLASRRSTKWERVDGRGGANRKRKPEKAETGVAG